MADVFLSYARENERQARLVADALEQRGWSVWWDRRIPHGKDFSLFIQQELDAARCIVVLWSTASVISQFVRDEATEGLHNERLVPAILEAVRPPLGFRQMQAADLTGWDGDSAHGEFARLMTSIEALVPRSVARPAEAASAVEQPEASESGSFAYSAAGLAGIPPSIVSRSWAADERETPIAGGQEAEEDATDDEEDEDRPQPSVDLLRLGGALGAPVLILIVSNAFVTRFDNEFEVRNVPYYNAVVSAIIVAGWAVITRRARLSMIWPVVTIFVASRIWSAQNESVVGLAIVVDLGIVLTATIVALVLIDRFLRLTSEAVVDTGGAPRNSEPAIIASALPAVSPEAAAWRCRVCGEAVEPQFDSCWSCGTARDERPV